MSDPERSGGWSVVTHAPNQPIAEMVQGILREEGIHSFTRRALAFDVPDFLAAGARAVLVPDEDAERARSVLDALDDTPPEDGPVQ